MEHYDRSIHQLGMPQYFVHETGIIASHESFLATGPGVHMEWQPQLSALYEYVLLEVILEKFVALRLGVF